MLRRSAPFLLALLALPARAVIVQGRVAGPLGVPVAGARVQLILLSAGARSVANSVSGLDGTYEIRTDLAGRFVLLTSSAYYAPQISPDFYAGRTNLLTRDIALDPASLSPRLSDLPAGLESTLAELSTRVTQIAPERLLSRAFIAHELPLSPATLLIETGQTGQPAFLSGRGANPDAGAVLLDGQQIQPLGGPFDFGRLAATPFVAVASMPAVELASGPNPLHPRAAEAFTVALHSARAANIRPALLFSGDAGNLHTAREEAALSLTHSRLDLLAAASRFDTSNALPNNRFHDETASANLGYNLSAATSARLILRDSLAAAPLPIPYDLGLQPSTRRASQDIDSTFTFESTTAGNWRNLLRYGLVRSREETLVFLNPPGRQVTLTGANGVTVSAQAAPFPLPARQDQASNRDEAAYETAFPFTTFLHAFFSFHFEDERALNSIPNLRQTRDRTNLVFALSLSGELKHRLFYEASGDLTHSTLLGLSGSPRLGLTYVPVLPGARRLKGTAFHASAATGNREPALPEQAQAIFSAARARTFDVSADQHLYREKLVLYAAFFHNQFSHQAEILSLHAPPGGIGPTLSGTQAFRTEGFESELRFQPRSRLLLRGGYTYLASLVEQSVAAPAFNPAFPTLPIGATAPLVGQRPFRRPPHSGFFALQYTAKSFAASLQTSLSSRSDDSTFTADTPVLLLPNRNLDHGYTRMDAGFTYALLRHATLFAQLTNLLNSQHLAPIGYPSAPFTFRTGLKIRLGGE